MINGGVPRPKNPSPFFPFSFFSFSQNTLTLTRKNFIVRRKGGVLGRQGEVPWAGEITLERNALVGLSSVAQC